MSVRLVRENKYSFISTVLCEYDTYIEMFEKMILMALNNSLTEEFILKDLENNKRLKAACLKRIDTLKIEKNNLINALLNIATTFSNMECEVYYLTLKGMSTSQIAKQLECSQGYVSKTRKKIMDKVKKSMDLKRYIDAEDNL